MSGGDPFVFNFNFSVSPTTETSSSSTTTAPSTLNFNFSLPTTPAPPLPDTTATTTTPDVPPRSRFSTSQQQPSKLASSSSSVASVASVASSSSSAARPSLYSRRIKQHKHFLVSETHPIKVQCSLSKILTNEQLKSVRNLIVLDQGRSSDHHRQASENDKKVNRCKKQDKDTDELIGHFVWHLDDPMIDNDKKQKKSNNDHEVDDGNQAASTTGQEAQKEQETEETTPNFTIHLLVYPEQSTIEGEDDDAEEQQQQQVTSEGNNDAIFGDSPNTDTTTTKATTTTTTASAAILNPFGSSGSTFSFSGMEQVKPQEFRFSDTTTKTFTFPNPFGSASETIFKTNKEKDKEDERKDEKTATTRTVEEDKTTASTRVKQSKESSPSTISDNSNSSSSSSGTTTDYGEVLHDDGKYSWHVHSQVLSLWIPSFFNETAKLMGVNDSLDLHSNQLAYDISPRHVRQLIHFMYRGSLTIDNLEDVIVLIELCDFLVCHTLRDLLLAQLEKGVSYHTALYFLGLCGARSDTMWGSLANRCIAEVGKYATQILLEVLSSTEQQQQQQAHHHPYMKEISFENMCQMLKAIEDKNMHYLRWTLFNYWTRATFGIDLSERKYVILDQWFKSKPRLSATTTIPTKVTSSPPPIAVASSTADFEPCTDDDDDDDDDDNDNDNDEHLREALSESDSSEQSTANIANTPSSSSTSTTNVETARRAIFEESQCPVELIDLLCLGDVMNDWNFILQKVIVPEIAHHFNRECDTLIEHSVSIINLVLQSDLIEVTSEDQVVHFLMQWYEKNRGKSTKQSVVALFSNVRFYHISLSCINRLCAGGMRELLDRISPNMIRSILEFKVSNFEAKVNREKASLFGHARTGSTWIDLLPQPQPQQEQQQQQQRQQQQQSTSKFHQRHKRKSKSHRGASKVYRTIETDSDSDSADKNNDDDDADDDDVTLRTNTKDAYLSDRTKIEVLDLMISMFETLNLPDSQINGMIKRNEEKERIHILERKKICANGAKPVF